MSDKRPSEKPVLTPLEDNRDLFAFQKLERNPPAKRDSLHDSMEQASKSDRGSASKNGKS